MSIHFIIGPNYDWEHLFQSYLKLVKPSSVVLEIGASSTDQTQKLSKFAKKVIGIEYFPHRLPQNTQNIEYRLGDWQKLTKIIPKNSIDIVISAHTIEHVDDDLTAINQLYQVLKPGGQAIFNTPNRLRLTRRIIEIFTGPRIFPHWEHVREYSYTDLFNLLKKSKFSNYKITPVVFGISAGLNLKFFSTTVPRLFTNLCNYWEITVVKS